MGPDRKLFDLLVEKPPPFDEPPRCSICRRPVDVHGNNVVTEKDSHGVELHQHIIPCLLGPLSAQ